MMKFNAHLCYTGNFRFFATMSLRKSTEQELRFIAYMIREGKGKINPRSSETLRVASMDDGGMGSLLLYPDGKIITGRSFGRTLHEIEFKDADHVAVVASLNSMESCSNSIYGKSISIPSSACWKYKQSNQHTHTRLWKTYSCIHSSTRVATFILFSYLYLPKNIHRMEIINLYDAVDH